MAAAMVLLSHSQMATLRDSFSLELVSKDESSDKNEDPTYRTSLKLWVFSSVLETIE